MRGNTFSQSSNYFCLKNYGAIPYQAQGQQGLDNSLDQTFNSSTVKTKPELIAISTIHITLNLSAKLAKR
jgi:hypothetical protein